MMKAVFCSTIKLMMKPVRVGAILRVAHKYGSDVMGKEGKTAS